MSSDLVTLSDDECVGATSEINHGSLVADLEGIVTELAPQFENQKQLARELRSALFPI
jgi:hypothetical protein